MRFHTIAIVVLPEVAKKIGGPDARLRVSEGAIDSAAGDPRRTVIPKGYSPIEK
jgi:hypothetical protein